MRTAAFVCVLALAVPQLAGAERQTARPDAATQPPAPDAAQPPATTSGSAQSFFEFLLARYLENEGDELGALEALKRAEAADPKSAEIKAEMAALFARQNKGAEAVAAAERAIALDPESAEAHRILGLVFAAWADAGLKAPAGRNAAELRQQAIDHLSKIIDTPAVATDLGLQVTLARLQVRAGQHDKAIPILERVVSQGPTSTEPYTLLAEARMAAGRLEQAAEALAVAAGINPRHYATLGELYERIGNWGAAAEAYTNAVEAARIPTRDLRLRMAGALVNVGSREAADQARTVLQEMLAAAPQDTRALYLLSNANRQLDDLAGAEDAARQMLAADPTSLSALHALSQVFFAQRQPAKVLDLLAPIAKDAAARAKGRESDAALVMAQLGFAHLQLGNPTAAIAAFTTAKEFAPRNPAFEAYLIQAHLSAKQYARAAELASDALRRHPHDTRLVALRADALADGGRREEAVKLLQDTLAAAPEDDDLLLKLGAIFEEGGKIEEAEKEFRRIIERDPLHAPALNYLGYMLADRGLRLPEAITLIERALKIDPDNPAYLDSLGWALFKNGQTEAAEAPLRKAAAALESESVIQDHLGDVLADRGKHDEAIAAWERALKGDGEGIERASVERKIRDARNRRR